jgi:dTDP-4-dehydrorhamnose 3,5-epimerase
MLFTELNVAGSWLLEDDVFLDDRGSFARLWVRDDFQSRGLETGITQFNLSTNHERNTLRGLHFQLEPYQEVKVVRALRGAIFDVAVDLRPDSPTYLQWAGMELSAGDRRSVYLPRGVAHGYQTLTDDAEVMYFVSASYSPAHQAGVRWNDAAFGIDWPLGAPAIINPRDANYPDYQPARRPALRRA